MSMSMSSRRSSSGVRAAEGEAPFTNEPNPHRSAHFGDPTEGREPEPFLRQHSSLGGLLLQQRSAVMNPMVIMESIKGLHELHQQGGLTQEEFTLAKQQILESPSSSTAVSEATSYSKANSNRGRGHYHRPHARRHSSHHPHHHRDWHSRTSGSPSLISSGNRSLQSSSSSSTTSTSSSSDSKHFMVLPQARVWKDLDTRSDRSSSPTFSHSPPDAMASGGVLGLGTAVDRSATEPTTVVTLAADETLVRHLQQQEVTLTSDAPAAAGLDPLPLKAVQFAPVESQSSNTFFSASGTTRYGTFQPPPGWADRGAMRDKRAPSFVDRDIELQLENQVHVHYFNSRGRTGKSFAEVELLPDDLRASIFLRKNKIVNPPTPVAPEQAFSPVSPNAPDALGERTRLERGLEASDVLKGKKSSKPSTTCSSSSASFLEQSLNWHWIDVTGKDESERQYKRVLRGLTKTFNLCESFLVDREHMLTLPQVCESPSHPGQYLLNLRVASQRVSLADDNAQLLTNRWMVLIDLHRHVIITIHRMDTRSMAVLRSRWSKVMASSDISFQQFLLKILDDAIYTYQLSLDVHEDLLDKCELKLFAGSSSVHYTMESTISRVKSASTKRHIDELTGIDDRILMHFADSSSSPFLRQLLDPNDTRQLPKGETNSFLHHLHRRTAVQLRMLNLTQPVLAEAFTKLRLCSKELSTQMTSSCRELSDRALEVRDDAKTLLDLHLALQSFRTNELMAVLTRLSLFFTPCTFVAGVYGMNFHNLPELSWNYGYFYFWAICIVLVLGMQVYFHRAGLRG